MGAAKPAPACAATSRKLRLAVVEEQVRRLRVADIAVNVADGLVDVPVDGDQIEVAIEIDIEERAAEAEAVARRPVPMPAACAMSV